MRTITVELGDRRYPILIEAGLIDRAADALAPLARGRPMAIVTDSNLRPHLARLQASLEAAGIARIRGYVGRGSSCPTWLHAARTLAEAQRDIYPHWGLADWLAVAKRLYRVTSAGRIVLDYDLKIAEPFRVPGAETGPDMWQALGGLGGAPVLLVRGERSDVLGAATARQMAGALPDAELVTVPSVGHAPMLTEPEALAGIERLLARVDGA